MNRLKTRLLVTAAAIAVLGTSAQAAELVQKDDAPVTRTDSLAGLSVDSSSDSSETAETAAAEESSTEAESLAPDAQVRSKLTGRLVDAEVGTKRPMAIMLNNIYDACPQAGIEEAGIVYEAPVEGGLTRLWESLRITAAWRRSVLSEAAVTITLILQKSLMPFTSIMARPFMP